jgi:uncharacterized protein YciI
MKTLFVVTLIKGHAWDEARPMRSQAHWTEHAALMDQLGEDGFIVLGGPIGDESRAMLVMDAADESQVRSIFATDPWIQSGVREIQAIEPWTILLQSGQKP